METADPKNAPTILLWLVREDYGASIAFTAMKMDPSLYRAVRKDGLPAVAKVSLGLKKGNAGDSVRVIRQPEYFRLNGRDFAAYEYSTGNEGIIIRTVVFDTGSRFMECTALSGGTSSTRDETTTLFETQQSVLSSMVVR
ncbi:MAG: hypothetical protein QHI48_09400 [Bacteroidota bacterium]|nr:hypothetical protein [Bacteroidota bacterium]